jgi:hypothetical protein
MVPGFFQGTIRTSEAYDHASKDLIINDFAQRFAWFHRAHPDAIRQRLRWVADELSGLRA